eukprot:1579626-Rhodomonas_salina.2
MQTTFRHDQGGIPFGSGEACRMWLGHRWITHTQSTTPPQSVITPPSGASQKPERKLSQPGPSLSKGPGASSFCESESSSKYLGASGCPGAAVV